MNKVTKLLIPVHLPRHWSLVFINLQRKVSQISHALVLVLFFVFLEDKVL